MRFFDIALLAPLALSATALGAECFAQSGGNNCLGLDSVNAIVEQHCRANWQQSCRDYTTWGAGQGQGHIGHIGSWDSQNECVQAGMNVVNGCYGQRDGGSWSFNGKSISVSFCLWADGT